MAFDSPQKEDLFLEYVNGINDPRIKKYMLIPPICGSNKLLAYAIAYYEGAKSIFDAYNKTSSAIPFIAWEHPITLPILFNCRHSIELAIKAYLKEKNTDYDTVHGLHNLWNLIDPALFDEINHTEMCKFIDIINSIDYSSTTFRYPEVKTDVKWVNCKLLLKTTNNFINIIKVKINKGD